MVGSFINVLVARLPYEKSIVWPSSRCFACYRKIRFTDNIPILGYLRLRGKCRYCSAPFSARYLWVELGTGIAFLGLFLAEVVFNCFNLPGVTFNSLDPNGGAPSPAGGWRCSFTTPFSSPASSPRRPSMPNTASSRRRSLTR